MTSDDRDPTSSTNGHSMSLFLNSASGFFFTKERKRGIPDIEVRSMHGPPAGTDPLPPPSWGEEPLDDRNGSIPMLDAPPDIHNRVTIENMEDAVRSVQQHQRAPPAPLPAPKKFKMLTEPLVCFIWKKIIILFVMLFFTGFVLHQFLSGGNINQINLGRYVQKYRDGARMSQPLAQWDVMRVNNMGELFAGHTFNEDLNEWDVSGVSTTAGMFRDASVFNGDIAAWDVSSVLSMAHMFDGASGFDRDISGWQVDNVEDMEMMFYGASYFNQNLSAWAVRKVKNFGMMFAEARNFNTKVCWDVDAGAIVDRIFEGAGARACLCEYLGDAEGEEARDVRVCSSGGGGGGKGDGSGNGRTGSSTP
eukprot:CAMPEP_0194286662 /NCGR_PEP_ID=MMETSP0169-20130528/32996_1 /TAXON_ID=218684 /ORGANISM="Corethron pennatum, Strain L29A3" /LENGTH=362 /DNA_ID=CAMNT_0039033153 /DNA_START=79 /DNA_END=1167 /DNA_ORIENTATION=+